MGTPSTGAVVLIPFPFSDLSHTKLRPAVVLASAGRGDVILCQVTSQPYVDPHVVWLNDQSFAEGSLRRESYARAGKLFTAHESVIAHQVGRLKDQVLEQIVDAVVALLRKPGPAV